MCALGMSVISVAEGEFALEYYFLRIFIFFILTFHYSKPNCIAKEAMDRICDK